MKWLAGLLLFAAGCDVVFRIDKVQGDAGSGGRIDAAAADADLRELPAFCPMPVIFEPFDVANPVCGWGSADGTGQSIHDSVMDLPQDGLVAPTFNGCTVYNAVPFTSTGVFLHVTKVLTVANAYTKLGVREAANTTPALDVALISDGVNVRFTIGGVTFAQTTMSYEWWLLQQPSANLVVAAVSNDGTSWVTLASTPIASPRAINVDIGAGISSTPSSPGAATFAAFGVCN